MQVDTRSLAERDSDTYLSAPPYWGFSDYAHLGIVKQLCGEGGERVYDEAKRAWGTTSLQHLVRLVGSGMWFPVNVDSSFYGTLTTAANKRLAEQEKEWVANEEKRLAAAKREQEQAALKAAKERREQAAKAAKAAREAAAAKKREDAAAAAAAKAAEEPDKKRRLGVEPNAAEVAECTRLGFTAHAIEFSNTLNELGPRGTLSNEGRILRWCSFKDHKEEDGPLVEYTREERVRCWNYEQRFPLPETESRAYAAELNKHANEWTAAE